MTSKKAQALRREILDTQRRRIRYHLYRLRSEHEDLVPATKESKRIGAYYESEQGFDGWLNFARTWDVAHEGSHDRIVTRLHTEEQEWNTRLAAIARPLTPK